MELAELLDLYTRRCERREHRVREFLLTDRPGFMVVQHPYECGGIFGACNSVEAIYRNNMEYIESFLRLDCTDDLPYLEPWIGTGVYANAFGCEYHFRDDMAPHVRYRCHKIEELRSIEYPDYRQSPIMNMVLDCIDCFRERTHDRLPIALTDTQSPLDTATLVLDAAECFVGCYTHPELLSAFLQQITDLIVEFSRVQMDHIGPKLLVQPGHLMPSVVGGPGISISDDNLAVASPKVNRSFALPFDEQLANRFGGLAIHSCGVWTHTMAMLREFQNMTAIECHVGYGRGDNDPNPNRPAQVQQAVAGHSIVVKTRLGSDIERALAALDELASPQMRLVVEIGYTPEHAERNYQRITEKLEQIYAN